MAYPFQPGTCSTSCCSRYCHRAVLIGKDGQEDTSASCSTKWSHLELIVSISKSTTAIVIIPTFQLLAFTVTLLISLSISTLDPDNIARRCIAVLRTIIVVTTSHMFSTQSENMSTHFYNWYKTTPAPPTPTNTFQFRFTYLTYLTSCLKLVLNVGINKSCQLDKVLANAATEALSECMNLLGQR